MTKRLTRLNTREINDIKKYLISKDGNRCKICGEIPNGNKLIIDHIDNNCLNNTPENLQLCCQSCNIKKNPPYREKIDVDNFSLSHSLTDNESDEIYLPVFSEVTLENYPVWKNLKSEPKFIKWLYKEMSVKLRMEIKQVLNDGANIAGCSSKTTTSYLDKLVYETGPYKIEKNPETGSRILCWKQKYFPFKKEINKWTK